MVARPRGPRAQLAVRVRVRSAARGRGRCRACLLLRPMIFTARHARGDRAAPRDPQPPPYGIRVSYPPQQQYRASRSTAPSTRSARRTRRGGHAMLRPVASPLLQQDPRLVPPASAAIQARRSAASPARARLVCASETAAPRIRSFPRGDPRGIVRTTLFRKRRSTRLGTGCTVRARIYSARTRRGPLHTTSTRVVSTKHSVRSAHGIGRCHCDQSAPRRHQETVAPSAHPVRQPRITCEHGHTVEPWPRDFRAPRCTR